MITIITPAYNADKFIYEPIFKYKTNIKEWE